MQGIEHARKCPKCGGVAFMSRAFQTFYLPDETRYRIEHGSNGLGGIFNRIEVKLLAHHVRYHCIRCDFWFTIEVKKGE